MGDTNTPAEPQFAVLELGEGYGGSSEWTWKLPSSMSAEEIGISDGTGLYGHSAVMLPGDVLMIAGGYSISKQSSKRAISAQHNSQIYMYNVTSNSRVKSYSNPAVSKTASAASSSKHNGLSSGQKAGLGVGLGIGIPLAILFAVCAWKYDRKRRVRGKRDSQLRELALGAERAHFWGRDDPHQASSIRSSQMSERFDNGAAYGWAGNRSLSSNPHGKRKSKPTDRQNRLSCSWIAVLQKTVALSVNNSVLIDSPDGRDAEVKLLVISTLSMNEKKTKQSSEND